MKKQTISITPCKSEILNLKNISGSKQTQVCLQDQNSYQQQFIKEQDLLKSIYNNKKIFQIIHITRSQEKQKKSELQQQQQQYYEKTSLERISQMFFQTYLTQKHDIIYLDKLSAKLKIKKRRIYDLINITESMNLVRKRSKNTYEWLGFQKIFEDEPKKIQKIESKKQNSLQYIAFKFKNVFDSESSFLTLDQIFDKLFPINKQNSQSKKRRIYDIAKIFKKLCLIKKFKHPELGIGYIWIGEKGIKDFQQSILKAKSSKIEQESNSNNTSQFEVKVAQYIKQCDTKQLVQYIVQRFTNKSQMQQLLNEIQKCFLKKYKENLNISNLKKSAFSKCN